MTLSPEDRAELIRQAAAMVAEAVLARTNPDELIRLPVKVACTLSGKTQRQLAKQCHIIREGSRDHYITLAEYKARLLPQPHERNADQNNAPPGREGWHSHSPAKARIA